MITVTFIRHGESEDNRNQIWAGWKDAPLSELGQKQAKSLGLSLSSTPLTHIYASPLLRAHSTGQAVLSGQPDPKPPLTITPDIREQNFGIAEGHPWILDIPEHKTKEELYEKGIFPVLYGRDERFPEGESLNELGARAAKAIRECVVPYLNEGEGVYIAMASHGLCIAELLRALLELDPEAKRDRYYAGLMNTAWTRATVRVRGEVKGPIDPMNPPPLEVHVTHVNEKDHLRGIMGELEENAAEIEAKAYFAGGGAGEKIPDVGV